MPVFEKDQRFILFIHIPKNGGSSLNKLFVQSGWVRHFYSARKGKPDGRLRSIFRVNPQHWDKEILGQIFSTARFDAVFGVVRHPIARIKSEFAFRNRQLRPEELTKRYVTRWLLKSLYRYLKDRTYRDNHLKPQSRFILKGMQLYRIEDGFSQIVRAINQEFKLDLDEETKIRANDSSGYNVSSKDVPLSWTAKCIVVIFYFQDFVRLGYGLREPKRARLFRDK